MPYIKVNTSSLWSYSNTLYWRSRSINDIYEDFAYYYNDKLSDDFKKRSFNNRASAIESDLVSVRVALEAISEFFKDAKKDYEDLEKTLDNLIKEADKKFDIKNPKTATIYKARLKENSTKEKRQEQADTFMLGFNVVVAAAGVAAIAILAAASAPVTLTTMAIVAGVSTVVTTTGKHLANGYVETGAPCITDAGDFATDVVIDTTVSVAGTLIGGTSLGAVEKILAKSTAKAIGEGAETFIDIAREEGPMDIGEAGLESVKAGGQKFVGSFVEEGIGEVVEFGVDDKLKIGNVVTSKMSKSTSAVVKNITNSEVGKTAGKAVEAGTIDVIGGISGRFAEEAYDTAVNHEKFYSSDIFDGKEILKDFAGGATKEIKKEIKTKYEKSQATNVTRTDINPNENTELKTNPENDNVDNIDIKDGEAGKAKEQIDVLEKKELATNVTRTDINSNENTELKTNPENDNVDNIDIKDGEAGKVKEQIDVLGKKELATNVTRTDIDPNENTELKTNPENDNVDNIDIKDGEAGKVKEQIDVLGKKELATNVTRTDINPNENTELKTNPENDNVDNIDIKDGEAGKVKEQIDVLEKKELATPVRNDKQSGSTEKADVSEDDIKNIYKLYFADDD